jgi:murein DD-endopeptidase MepM/ murein hydrolase activator NlpD
MSRRGKPSVARLTRRLRLPAALLVVALLGGSVAGPAFADSIDDQVKNSKAQQAANQKAQDDAEAAMEGVSANLVVLAQQLAETQAKVAAAQVVLQQAQAAAQAAQREAALIAARLQDAQDEQSRLQTTIADDATKTQQMQAAIGAMAREAYRSGPQVSTIGVLLGADSTDDFVQSYGLMTTALRTQSQVLDQLRTTEATDRNAQVRMTAVTDSIAELKAQADEKAKEAAAAQAAAQQASNELAALQAQQQQQEQQLEAQRASIQAQLAALDAEAAQIKAQLQQAIAAQQARDAAAAAAARAKGKAPAKPQTAPVGSAWFVNPTSTNPIYVTSPYGWRFHPILHYYRLHAGIDLRAPCGTPIYAGRAGTVLWAEYRSGFGSQVMVDHGIVNGNGLASSYNHLSKMVVGTGAHVSTGQLVGYAGTEGLSTGCHLHFEVYVNGSTVDPAPYLGV